MFIRSGSDGDKLDFFKELYQTAKNNLAQDIDDLTKWRKQYEGDDEIDGSSEKAEVVRNITYELIESQVSSDLPTCKCRARSYSEDNDKCAKSAERLCNMQLDRLPFEQFNDEDERETYTLGSSIWLIEWDESQKTRYASGDIKITLVSRQDFFPQPFVTDESDLEYFFVRFLSTKDSLIRSYGISREEAAKTAIEPEAHGYAMVSNGEDDDSEVATVVVCYYKDADGVICRFVFSGDCVLSDVSDYYARKRKKCTKCGRVEAICTCDSPRLEDMNEEYEELDKDILDGDKVIISSMQEVVRDDGTIVMEAVKGKEVGANGITPLDEDGLPIAADVHQPKMRKTRLPYYKPKTLPIVIRRNTSQSGSLFGQSDAAFIRPQQQEINKIETRIHQKLMFAGITPMVPEDARITLNNTVFGQVIKMRAGENKGNYGVLDTTPNIQQDVAQSERIYQQARFTLGITKTFQGHEDSTAKSGVAKQAQIQQAAGRMESKRRMKHFAYSQIYRIIFEFYLAFADEPRPISYRDAFGTIHNEKFNRYKFYRRDELTGEYYPDDEYLFSTDTSGGLEDQRETMWEINKQNLIDGAFGVPGDVGTNLRYWRAQSRAHYPHADDQVEFFNAMYQAQQQQAMAERDITAAANNPEVLNQMKAMMQKGGMTNERD